MIFPMSLLAYFDVPLSSEPKRAEQFVSHHFQILTGIYRRNDLLPYRCPNCKERGGLYQGYVYINCDACINFFTVDDLISFNLLHTSP